MSSNLRQRLEAARLRKERQKEQAEAGSDSAPSCNLLIISDVHLGADIKRHARIDYLKRMPELNRDLCDFLEYYGEHRIAGKPWRLVINGDFVDFLTVTVTPSERSQQSDPELRLDADEQRFGLDADEEKAAWKLERIVERHHLVFTYLADFVGRGNYLEMLYGNHDAEFFWPRAKKAFVRELVDIYFGTEQVTGMTEEEYAGHITWHPWFYYEPERIYIEHGSQYDDFSSFEYWLCPVAPFKTLTLAMPTSHIAIRFFVNHMPDFSTHNKDNWTMWDFLRWLSDQGWSRAWGIVATYVRLTRRMLRYSRRLQSSESFEVAATHRERLEKLTQRYDIDRAALVDIDKLHNPPIHRTLGGTIQAAALDQWAYLAAVLLVFLGALVVFPGWTKLLAVVLVIGMALVRSRSLTWFRNVALGGEVPTLIPPKLNRAATEIADVLPVRYVVFGHTHRPVELKVREDPPGWYVNSGSWLQPQYKEQHLGGCRSSLNYLIMLDGEPPELLRMRWCQRESRPVPFGSGSLDLDTTPSDEVLEPEEKELQAAVVGNEAPAGRPRRPSRVSLRKRRY